MQTLIIRGKHYLDEQGGPIRGVQKPKTAETKIYYAAKLCRAKSDGPGMFLRARLEDRPFVGCRGWGIKEGGSVYFEGTGPPQEIGENPHA